MGLRLERLLKNKDKICSSPWNCITRRYVVHKMGPAVWTFDALSKKKQSVKLFANVDLIHFPLILVHNICSIFLPSITHVCYHIGHGYSKEASA